MGSRLASRSSTPSSRELALSLPTNLKVRGLAKKRLLRQAAAPLIPASIVRARKRGFSIPAAAWLRGELEPLARELLAQGRTRAQGYFEPSAVSGLLDDHVSRRQDNSRQLWGLMCFSLWASRPTAPRPPRTLAATPPRRVRRREHEWAGAAQRAGERASLAGMGARAAGHRTERPDVRPRSA